MLGRLVLRDSTTMTAVDQELIHHDPNLPDKFVVRAQSQQHPSAAAAAAVGTTSLSASVYGAPPIASNPTAAGGGGSVAGGLLEDKVAHFYYQVLADSFAKELPGVRRAEEQLAALAGERMHGRETARPRVFAATPVQRCETKRVVWISCFRAIDVSLSLRQEGGKRAKAEPAGPAAPAEAS